MLRTAKCFKYIIVQESKCSRFLLVNCFLFAYFSPFKSNTWDNPSVVVVWKWCSLNHFAIFAFYDIIFSVCVVECVSSYYCSTWPPTRWMGPEKQISLSLSLIFRIAQSKSKQCERTDTFTMHLTKKHCHRKVHSQPSMLHSNSSVTTKLWRTIFIIILILSLQGSYPLN